MKLLKIDSSARLSSVSRQLTDRFAKEWQKANPIGEVIRRDLAMTELPAITDDWTRAAFLSPDQRSENEQRALAVSETLTNELVAAQEIVIGAPMYNFTISASLKGWIDHVVRPGKTIAFGPDGAKGLLADKRVAVLTSRGGLYSNGSARARSDFQEPYLREILGYIGLTDITFIHAENQQRPDQAKQLREAALAQIVDYVASNTLRSAEL